MAVVAIAFVGLRELSPQLRDQLMVSDNERALVDARARGIDIEKIATPHPWRSMLRLDLIASALGISVFLLIYFASVSVLTLYWVVIFNRTTAEANGINTWYWAVDAVMLIAIGVLSDRLRVRKPFMVIGGVAAIVVTMLMISQVNHPHTGFSGNVTIAVLLGLAIGCAYTPWMASYTEQVEAHNPALAAHGLAVWGWILRIVVALSFIVLPRVITTSTVLVDNQAAATNLQTFQAAQPYVPAAGNIHPPAAPAGVITSLNAMEPYGPGQALAALLKGYATSHDIMAGMAAVPAALKLQVQGLLAFSPLASDIQAGRRVSNAQIAGVQASSPQLATLLRVEPKLVPAQKASPGEWKRWWWVCAVGQLVFLVLVFFMRGRWSPRAAKADFDQHERLVATELEKLRTGEPLEPLLWPDLAPTGTDDSSLWVHA